MRSAAPQAAPDPAVETRLADAGSRQDDAKRGGWVILKGLEKHQNTGQLMQLISFPMAGGGGRPVLVNPEQVVCLVDQGERRTQIVTTGLSGETSMTLVVEMEIKEVGRRLTAPAG